MKKAEIKKTDVLTTCVCLIFSEACLFVEFVTAEGLTMSVTAISCTLTLQIFNSVCVANSGELMKT